jgi:sugar fermentation stimulation protein A
MKFFPPLIPATLIRRYKRFLADVELASGEVITVHTPNAGAMTGCADPGSQVFLRKADNPKRKYPYSWEMSENRQGVMVGVHTGITNALVKEGILSFPDTVSSRASKHLRELMTVVATGWQGGDLFLYAALRCAASPTHGRN